MNIKFFGKLKKDFLRKRDDEICTHSLHINVTPDEALLISSMLAAKKAQGEPTVSLIRAILCQMATAFIDDPQLIQYMAEWRTKKRLAEDLSVQDYSRAVNYLKDLTDKKELTKQPILTIF